MPGTYVERQRFEYGPGQELLSQPTLLIQANRKRVYSGTRSSSLSLVGNPCSQKYMQI